MTNHMETSSEISTPHSPRQAKVDFLREEIDEAIKQVRDNRRENRRKASYIKTTTILSSGIITVLLGLQINGLEQPFKNVALALGAIVTVLNALEPFFNYRALWVEHEIALWKFHKLRDKMDFYIQGIDSDQIKVDRLDEFQTEYQNIWDELSISWIQYRKQERA